MGTTQQDIIDFIMKHKEASGILLNINTFTDFFQWSRDSLLDVTTNKEMLQRGIYAHILGRCIVVSKLIPDGQIIPVSESFVQGLISDENGFTRIELVNYLNDIGMKELANILQMDEALI